MDYLFARGDGHQFFREKEAELRAEINSITKKELENSDDSLNLILRAKHSIKKIEFDDYYQIDKGEIQIDISNDRRFSAWIMRDIRRSPVYKTGRQIEIHLPFSGDPILFNFRPSSYTTVYPRADIHSLELIFEFHFFALFFFTTL